MLATEYHRTGTTNGGTSSSTSKYSCSAVSSETLSGSCGSRNNRVRTVRLVRRHVGAGGTLSRAHHHQPPLGFSIRGGHEHGTGVFVSHVEPGSEADQQGLRVGDQIIRINGFTIEDAVHKEVLQLISNHTHLTLKVRGVGMIPVKEQKNDSLSWQIISPSTSSSRSSPQFGEKTRDVRINIFVAPRSKLGCGICKGPDWKPGIFVQFTKEGGIAREAGLRPGDQIVQCNGVDFSDVPFNEAVNLMKTSRQLDLVIRKSAASELFPGESSGYNSSASSVTEDQNPAWSDPKRLSIVKEENHDLEDRLAHERLNKRISSNSMKWELDEWNEETESQYYKKTIINLSDTGSTIKGSADECRPPSEPNIAKKESEKDIQTVVEVHRSEIDDEIENNHSKLTKSASVSSFASVTSKSSITSATSSLSSAISMEIQRRLQKQASKEATNSIDEQLQVKKMLKNVTFDQQHQHNKLMNEFKQVHQKMFKPNENDGAKQNEVIGKDTMYRLAHKDLSKKLSNKLFDLVNAEEASSESSKKLGVTASPPPPPPPPPSSKTVDQEPSNTSTLKPSKTTKPKAPPVPPVKHSTLSFNQPPPCPTPDYDTLSIASSTSTILKKDQDAVEMESLDSFRMSAPSSVQPKPPCTYFQKRDMTVGGEEGQYGTIKGHKAVEKSKSVSVIIGEYQANTQPGKLNFLRRGPDTFKSDGSRIGLADELRHTLNRSNLRKRTESMDDLLSATQQIKPQSNGTVRISLKSNLSKEFTKSTSDLTEDFETSFKPRNKITINVNNEKKFDGSNNGIFKSNYGE
nr:unnamed protein product [Callosobruchus chinensis]